jgi:hypothetical protein
MNKDYNHHSIAKIYNFLGLARTLFTILIIYWLKFDRRIQAWSFFAFNAVYLVFSTLISEHLEYKGAVLFKEFMFFLWSVIIVINAHDDINPQWNLFVFWVLSILTIVFRFFIMMIEFYIYAQVIKKACIKNSLLNYKKDDIKQEEDYVQ